MGGHPPSAPAPRAITRNPDETRMKDQNEAPDLKIVSITLSNKDQTGIKRTPRRRSIPRTQRRGKTEVEGKEERI